jgi:hypothetical protein
MAGRPYNYNRAKLFGDAQVPAKVEFSNGAEASDEIEVTLTIKDADDFTIDNIFPALITVSATANAVPAALTPTAGEALEPKGTNDFLIKQLTQHATIIAGVKNGSEILINNSAAETIYLNVYLPNGECFSNAVTFAA